MTSFRLTLSSGRSVSAPAPIVVLRVFSRGIRRRPSTSVSRSVVQRDRDALPVELGINLSGAVDTKLGPVSVLDVDDQFGTRTCFQLTRRESRRYG